MSTPCQDGRRSLSAEKSAPANLGEVVSVRGRVVDIRFGAQLPPIYSMLRAGDEGRIVPP